MTPAAAVGAAAALGTAGAQVIGEGNDGTTAVMIYSTGLDWKVIMIVALMIVIVLQAGALIFLCGAWMYEKKKALRDAARPFWQDMRNGAHMQGQGGHAQEARQPEPEDEAWHHEGEVPPPPQPVAERIAKDLYVTDSGQCFHNAGCDTIRRRFARRLRGCNVCMP